MRCRGPARPAAALAAARRRLRSDAGVSSMEWALLTPVLILVLLAVVQFTMVFHARQVALAAAQSGARVARTQPVGGGWQDAAVAKATGDIDHIGPHLISGLHVDTGEVNDERWVQVSGTAVQVIPFMTFHVSQRSQGPIECFRPDVGAGVACQRGAGR
ncbi:TadE/TadG family type IV pilus assembly protein [Actinomadura montaniterrae]|uniref:Pilus assembly protein n=1 Tax=Actinomadura montaniterrae TaxID=1803903 RepID=A0A6L3VEJ6_9ACTN|nr:TadE/TadG family type IV pilus assembly protein [Actinomadura montaniterrae]KAB2363412.1 pilus assembly protein [Actinomadura montaniterrae]